MADIRDIFPKNKLAFDTIRIPLKDNSDVTSIDMDKLKEMVDYLMANGCNAFLTSWPYRGGACEGALKEALIDRYPRESYVLMDDMPTYNLYNPGDAERMYAESVQRLGLEDFDVFLTHAARFARLKNAEKVGALEFFRNLKKTGKTRYLGLGFIDSPENLEKSLEMLGDEIDVVQIIYNFFDVDDAANHAQECLDICRRYGKPVIAMEPNKGGYLVDVCDRAAELLRSENPNDTAVTWSLRHAAAQPEICCILGGMTNMEDARAYVEALRDIQPLTKAQEEMLAKARRIIREESPIPCDGCGACMEGCPAGIEIPALLSIQNMWEKLHDNEALVHYILHTDTAKRGHANECNGCGQCETVCPCGLNIVELLKQVSATFDNDMYRGFINY